MFGSNPIPPSSILRYSFNGRKVSAAGRYSDCSAYGNLAGNTSPRRGENPGMTRAGRDLLGNTTGLETLIGRSSCWACEGL